MNDEPLERKFVKPKTISDYLKCPICLDVFRDPIRLYCGHTFCDPCMNDYLKTGRTCPECRTVIEVKRKGIDLLAREIINQFEVFCPNEDCPWKGIYQDMERHVRSLCIFSERSSHKAKNKIKPEEKIVWHQMVDDEIQQKINEHTVKGSLQARILSRSQTMNLVNETKPVLPTSDTERKEVKKGKNKKMAKHAQVQKKRDSNFDFLSSLFQ